MKLKDLIVCSDILAEVKITGVTCDSRQIKEGFAFVCISGTKFDGHNFAEKALELGAAVVITERCLGLNDEITVAGVLPASDDLSGTQDPQFQMQFTS